MFNHPNYGRPSMPSPGGTTAGKRKVRELEVGPKDMKRYAKIAQLLVEGKKGADFQAAVQEFDKNHGGDPYSGPLYSEQGRNISPPRSMAFQTSESLFNDNPAHLHMNSARFSPFDTVSNNPPNTYLSAQRSTHVPYEPHYCTWPLPLINTVPSTSDPIKRPTRRAAANTFSIHYLPFVPAAFQGKIR